MAEQLGKFTFGQKKKEKKKEKAKQLKKHNITNK